MCVLRVSSSEVSFEDCMAVSDLPVVSHSIKGEKLRCSDAVRQQHELVLAVSDREWADFQGQIADAMGFLAHYEPHIRQLLVSHHASACLDFPLESRLNGDYVSQSVSLPAELLVLAGRIGLAVDLTVYDTA